MARRASPAEGEDLQLGPELARALALTFHELATNAAKYGSLSAPAGSLLVSWVRAPGNLDITWRERGGPAVAPPARSGFGTRFIERLFAGVGGRTQAQFLAAGLVSQISLPWRQPGTAPLR